jgi:hypothetical protein
MRHLSEDEAARMMGLGYVGELYQDLDGYLYEWVEGVDEWGDPIGFLQGLSEPEVAELSGLGALYQAPDGTLYQMQGLAEEEKPMEAMGPRAQGQRRLPGRRPRRPGPGVKGGPPRKKGGFLKKLLPIAKFAAGIIPGVGPVARAALDVGSKLLMKPGVAGYAGLGALYAAPDGTIYQVRGLAEEDLDGLYADEELRGFAEDEELRGFAEDEELRGLDEDEELRGFAEGPELRGLAEDEKLRGLEQGYVREVDVSGLEAYVPAVKQPETRWFKPPTETPEIWKPLW